MITQYTIFGQVIKVLPKLKLYKKDSLGEWIPNKNIVYYQPDTKSYKITQENINQTICHEVIHSWLDKTGYTDLSANEHLVDLLGSCLNEFLGSKK